MTGGVFGGNLAIIEGTFLYWGSLANQISLFIDAPLLNVPGAAYFYSNEGFKLATYILEKYS